MSTFDETDLARIEVATALFAAWSSGDVDAPRAYLTDDPMLWDSVGGLKQGWPAIREYFGHGLERYPDLVLAPTGEFWARPRRPGPAVGDERHRDRRLHGPGASGRKWSVPGLSFLVFDGLTVAAEYDYHDKGARQRSLES